MHANLLPAHNGKSLRYTMQQSDDLHLTHTWFQVQVWLELALQHDSLFLYKTAVVGWDQHEK